MLSSKELQARRKVRQRTKIRQVAIGRLRLSVFRSSQHIYAQVIDDAKGVTLVACSTLDKELKGKIKSGATVAAAKEVGMLLGARAKAKGATKVVFDRSGYLYHGRIKALADGAREGGMEF